MTRMGSISTGCLSWTGPLKGQCCGSTVNGLVSAQSTHGLVGNDESKPTKVCDEVWRMSGAKMLRVSNGCVVDRKGEDSHGRRAAREETCVTVSGRENRASERRGGGNGSGE